MSFKYWVYGYKSHLSSTDIYREAIIIIETSLLYSPTQEPI